MHSTELRTAAVLTFAARWRTRATGIIRMTRPYDMRSSAQFFSFDTLVPPYAICRAAGVNTYICATTFQKVDTFDIRGGGPWATLPD